MITMNSVHCFSIIDTSICDEILFKAVLVSLEYTAYPKRFMVEKNFVHFALGPAREIFRANFFHCVNIFRL